MEADENLSRSKPIEFLKENPALVGDIGESLGEANPGTWETLAQVAQSGSRCIIRGDTEGQAGWDSKQHDQAVGVHCSGGWTG